MNDFTMDNFSIMSVQWGKEFPSVQDLVEVALHAERNNFYSIGITWLPTLPDGFWQADEGLMGGWSEIIDDHPGAQHDSLAILPMIAYATSTIRFGFNAWIPTAIQPFYIAKYLTTLDIASNGRVVAPFGMGPAEEDGTGRIFEWLGNAVPAGRRGAAAEEALKLILNLWTEDGALDHEGEFFRGKQMMVNPKPVQKPHPEVWWAGEGKRSIRLAAQFSRFLEIHGESIALNGGQPLQRLREHYVPALAAANEKWGGSAKLAIQIGAKVLDKPLTSSERAKLFWYEDRPDNGFAAVNPSGSPEQCAEAIMALREAGVDHFALDFSHEGGESVSYTLEQMDAWTTDVMPLLSGVRVSA
jgi:alkanesulfonate monooxygenase SsuD/methylene tetrahydromethanopterin reductase-like flavin-dependent oxidoreductase (luciferase family)